MKKSALQCLILTCLFVAALCRWNTYVPRQMSWLQARNYCVEHHNDLTSISNENQDEDLKSLISSKGYHVWIGLHKDNDNWKWANGESATFFKWTTHQGESEDKRCVVQSATGWLNETCDKENHFLCSDSSLVLVEEKKTWEEAMEHCRDQNKGLVSLPSESALQETLAAIEGARTERVWTGLRYLGDGWLWASVHPVSYLEASSHVKTPQCPGWIHRCGALSLNQETVEGWDCADKLYFVCNKTLPT